MRLSDIKVFVTVVKEKSIYKAANKLFLTQPTTSRIIAKLEQHIDSDLFDRNDYPWKLTPMGELFFDSACKMLALEEDFFSKSISLMSLNQKKITVSAMFFEEQYLLPPVIKSFNLSYPDVEIEVIDNTSINMEKDLLEGKSDFAIVVLPVINATKLDFYKLKTYDILLMTSLQNSIGEKYIYPMDGKSFPRIDLSLLANERFILMKEGFLLRNICLETCSHFGFQPKLISEVYNLETARSLVENNHGNTFIFDQVAITHKKAGAYFKFKDLDISQAIGLAFVKNKKFTPIEKVFIDMLENFIENNY